MTNASRAAGPSPPPPPPGSTAVPKGLEGRPWWGPIDVLLAIPFVLVCGIVGVLIATIVTSIAGYDLGDDVELPAYGLFIAVLGQQIGQGLWPLIVSRWKGLGLASDWGFVTDLGLTKARLPRDIVWGLGIAVLCLIGAAAATEGMAALVGLGDPGEASNTAIISDNAGSPWLIGVIALIVVGAPLTEELLFRGLILRAFEKSFGPFMAVVGSTLLFTLPHIQADATWRESLVLLSAIAAIGLILAGAALRMRRLGPTIIAHFLFNGFGTVVALFSS